MSYAWILPEDTGALIEFDLTEKEGHESTAEVTDHPIEQGSNIADHVRSNPESLTLEVFVTNSPISDVNGGMPTSLQLKLPKYHPPTTATAGGVFREIEAAFAKAIDTVLGTEEKPPIQVEVLTFPTVFDRIQDTWDKLKDLKNRGQSLTVVTSVETYEKMVLTKVSLPRDAPGGATFSLDFRQITTVTTATVQAPKPAEKRGAPKTNKGGQSTTPKKENAQSLLNAGLNGVKNLLTGGPSQ